MFRRVRTSLSVIALLLGLACAVGVPAALAQSQVTLEFWHAWTGEREPLISEVLRRFEARYPWIDVQPRVMPASALEEQTVLAIAANSAPDLVMMQFSQSTGLGVKGAFQPLSPLAESDGTRLEDYFYPAVLEMLLNNPMAPKGEYYYLPQTIDPSWFLYYNIPHLQNAGLSTTQLPETWSEIEDYARRLVQSDGSGGVARIGLDVAAHKTPTTFLHLLGAAGGRRYSEDLRQVIMKDPESQVLMTLEWIDDFTRRINGGIEGVDALHAYPWSRFLEEKASMVLIGAYNTFVAEERGIEFGMAGVPRPDGYPARTPLTLGWGYGIPVNADYPEEAWLLLKFLTLEVDGGGWFMLQQGRPGGTIDMNLQPEYADINPYWHVIQQSFNRSTPGEAGPPVGGFDEIVGGMIRDVVYGEVGPQAAVERAHTLLEARLSDYWAGVDRSLISSGNE